MGLCKLWTKLIFYCTRVNNSFSYCILSIIRCHVIVIWLMPIRTSFILCHNTNLLVLGILEVMSTLNNFLCLRLGSASQSVHWTHFIFYFFSFSKKTATKRSTAKCIFIIFDTNAFRWIYLKHSTFKVRLSLTLITLFDNFAGDMLVVCEHFSYAINQLTPCVGI